MSGEVFRPSDEQLVQYGRHGIARIDVSRRLSAFRGFIDLGVLVQIEQPKLFWQKPGSDDRSDFAKVLVASKSCHHDNLPQYGGGGVFDEEEEEVVGLRFIVTDNFRRYLQLLAPVYRMD